MGNYTQAWVEAQDTRDEDLREKLCEEVEAKLDARAEILAVEDYEGDTPYSLSALVDAFLEWVRESLEARDEAVKEAEAEKEKALTERYDTEREWEEAKGQLRAALQDRPDGVGKRVLALEEELAEAKRAAASAVDPKEHARVLKACDVAVAALATERAARSRAWDEAMGQRNVLTRALAEKDLELKAALMALEAARHPAPKRRRA